MRATRRLAMTAESVSPPPRSGLISMGGRGGCAAIAAGAARGGAAAGLKQDGGMMEKCP
jgi:hypothetical protein